MTSQNKIAVVTGAGTGVGKAITTALVADGFTVVMTGRRREVLDEASKAIGEAQTVVVPADISDKASVTALFAEVEKRFGRLDLLVNNAGAGSPAIPMEELTAEQ